VKSTTQSISKVIEHTVIGVAPVDTTTTITQEPASFDLLGVANEE